MHKFLIISCGLLAMISFGIGYALFMLATAHGHGFTRIDKLAITICVGIAISFSLGLFLLCRKNKV